jgi:hypothetical protein
VKPYGADSKGKPCVKYNVYGLQRNGSRPRGRGHAVARAHDIRRRLHRRARQAGKHALSHEVLESSCTGVKVDGQELELPASTASTQSLSDDAPGYAGKMEMP